MTHPPDAQTPTPLTDKVVVVCDGAPGWRHMVDADFARQLERELTAERERGRRVREETIERCIGVLGTGSDAHQEQALADAATRLRVLSRAESAPKLI